MDEVRFDYYRRAGYDDALAATFTSSGDFSGLIRYWKPYEADAVEHLVVGRWRSTAPSSGHGGPDQVSDPPRIMRESPVSATSD